ncbi:MAG: carbohydrate ABC transporter permease [Thermodesulfobacteriota bacterium]|nr:carbohydrate ABC transporter permease [Thermodesulfobacteriota bacterium]
MTGIGTIRPTKVIWFVGIVLMLLMVLAPIFVMVKYAISDRSSVVTGGLPIPLWPYHPTIEQFQGLVAMDGFVMSALASMKVALLSATISLVVGTPAAYALVRYRFPGMMVLATLLISVRLFPDIVSVVPIVETFMRLRLVNTLLGVAMAHALLSMPYVIFIAMGVFETIPRDLDEQAQILGASKWYSFTRISLPVALPGLAAAAIYVFLLSWDEFILAYFLLAFGNVSTLPVLLQKILSWTPQHNLLAAISVTLSFPVILFTFIVQKYMQTGATAGAVK